jgi:hypothetical protein
VIPAELLGPPQRRDRTLLLASLPRGAADHPVAHACTEGSDAYTPATRTVLFAALFALSACGACSKSSSDGHATPPTTGGPTSKGPGTAAASDPSPVSQTGPDDSFVLKFDSPQPGAAGSELVATLTITPGQGYHINQDFKPKLSLTPPDGVTLAKNELVVDDASAMDKRQLVFAVKATAKNAGTYNVPGKIKFAVCTDDDTDCEPKRRDVSFTVTAK